MEGYNLIMSRWVCALLLPAALLPGLAAQQQPKEPPKPAPQQQDEQAPPEEDAGLQEKQYSFNPLQASKELQVGNEYFKKHSYRAAAMRFREATKWNANLAEAWLRLGEAEEKRRNPKDAKEAYEKYLELQPESKEAADVRKKIAGLR
jgi:tetratricopeptide (TPR) repeat protein